MLAALGQHDAERARGDFGVLEEQLVEIAHPVEQQQPGIGGLDLEVLFHHRRDPRRRFGGLGGVGGTGMDCWIVIGGGKLQSFGRRPIRFTVAVHVFHALRRIVRRTLKWFPPPWGPRLLLGRGGGVAPPGGLATPEGRIQRA